MSGIPATYRALVATLESELAAVALGFDDLTAADWSTPTKLKPPGPDRQPWTILELAGHVDISIGITRMVIAEAESGSPTPERDDVDFFIFPNEEVATEFYDYAYTMVDGKDVDSLAADLRKTFTKTIRDACATSPNSVGPFPGYEPYPLIRLDDFISTRIVEAVVHGIDLTDALSRPTTATPEGIEHAAGILDALLTRSSKGRRPTDLADDLAWVRAASGRALHPDPRLPVLR